MPTALSWKASPCAIPGQNPKAIGALRIKAKLRPLGVRPQTGPPPNGPQAHDRSRELWFGRPAPVGATPFGDGPVCSSFARAGAPISPRELVAYGSEKEAAGR